MTSLYTIDGRYSRSPRPAYMRVMRYQWKSLIIRVMRCESGDLTQYSTDSTETCWVYSTRPWLNGSGVTCWSRWTGGVGGEGRWRPFCKIHCLKTKYSTDSSETCSEYSPRPWLAGGMFHLLLPAGGALQLLKNCWICNFFPPLFISMANVQAINRVVNMYSSSLALF